MPSEAVAMVEALAQAGERFPAASLTSLLVSGVEDHFGQLRPAIARALAAHAGQLSPEQLLPGLGSAHAEVRTHTVALLGTLGDRTPIERILARLQDAEPQVRDPHAIGRPRVVGPRLPALEQVLHDPQTVWEQLTLDWYGEGERTLELCTGTAWWYRFGSTPLPSSTGAHS